MSRFFRLLSWRPGRYIRASADLFGWLALRALAQGITVILLARLLGAESYGLFVAALAVVVFFTPLAGLGLGGLLLRDCAKEPESLPQHLGMALVLWWPTALVFTLLAIFAITWLIPSSIPLYVLAIFAFSEVVGASFVELAARMEQSQHHVRAFGGLLAGLPIARLAGLLGYVMLLPPSPTGWLWVYAAANIAYAAAVARWLVARYCPIWPARREWGMARESLPFTIGALSFRLQAEFNKPILAQTSYSLAGNFSVAQRVIDLASLPLQAMQEVLWPRFYAGSHSHRQIWLIACSLVLLALFGGAILTVVAPWLPRLLGAGFEPTANMLVLLALLPALQLIRNLLNVFVAKQRQSILTMVYTGGGVAGVLFNILLIPAFGLRGAAWAAYLTEMAFIFILCAGIFLLRRTQNA